MRTKLYILAVIVLFLANKVAFAQFTNIAVTTNTQDQSETTIAISPLNSNYLLGAWNDFRSVYFAKPGYAFSTDGGSTWNDAVVTAPGYEYGFDPSVAFDKYANAYYCYVAAPDRVLGPIYVSRTTTFQPPFSWDHVQVSTSDTLQDKPYMAVDNGGSHDGRIYVSWTDFSSGSKIKFAYSTDQGVSFSTPVTLGSLSANPGTYPYFKPSSTNNPGNPTAVFLQGSMPAVGSCELYVIWMDVDFGYNQASYKIRKSTNGGVSFGAAKTVAQFTWQRNSLGGLDIFNLPSLAVDLVTGYVYVAYMDQVSETNTDMRVKWIRSTNGGNNWSTPVTIADFGVGWQFFPWLAVDATGRVTVALIHSSDVSLIDVYITESFDNGATFDTPVKVTGQRSNPGNAAWSHHYQGVALSSCDTYPLWTDYRNGNPDPFLASKSPPSSPENFTITNPEAIGQNPNLTWDSSPSATSYDIYRHVSFDPEWILLGSTQSTSYTDASLTILDPDDEDAEEFFYHVKAVNCGRKSGQSNIVSIWGFSFFKSISDELTSLPQKFELEQNFPNPFNPATELSYSLPKSGNVELVIVNLLGQPIRTLVSNSQSAGRHRITWDGRNDFGNQVGSGIYFYRIDVKPVDGSEPFTQIRKMSLLR